MKLTYQTLPYDDDDIRGADAENAESDDYPGEISNRKQWDDDCPWSEWYSAEDPIKGELMSMIFIFFCFLTEIKIVNFQFGLF